MQWYCFKLEVQILEATSHSFEVFRDPDIIDSPGQNAREPLARIIPATRAKKVRNHYVEIGGKSPILEFTERQARALETELGRFAKTRVFVRCAIGTH